MRLAELRARARRECYKKHTLTVTMHQCIMGDKRAISVRLGIDNGRHSPSREPPQGVLVRYCYMHAQILQQSVETAYYFVFQVYADAKVNWFFFEGAFILQSIHKRDHVQLERGDK